MTSVDAADSGHRLHVGIIMDGNGRWAQRQGRSRYHGHRAGAQAVRRVVRAAPDLGITTLTLYAFSADNWKRPEPEVQLLFRLFERYLRGEVRECVDNDIALRVIGRRDRLGPRVIDAVEHAERATGHCRRLLLRIAVDYSGRASIVAAAERLRAAAAAPESLAGDQAGEEFGRLVAGQGVEGRDLDEVDLIIRTGGEQRLSDFLLWESAYAELYFTPVMWPEFGRDDLAAAVREFARRERRYGCVPSADSGAVAASHAASLNAGASA